MVNKGQIFVNVVKERTKKEKNNLAFKLESQSQKRTQSNFRFTRKIYIFLKQLLQMFMELQFLNAKKNLGNNFKFYSQSKIENLVKFQR